MSMTSDNEPNSTRGNHGHDRMVVGFTTTCAISAYRHQDCELEFRSWPGVINTTYVITFVSDLWQVGGFLWVLFYPLPIKLTTMI